MITQNLHSFFKQKAKDERQKTSLLFFNKLVFSFLFSLFSFLVNAQDSIVPQATISEKTNLEFQEYFFKALTEKAINNHQTAIESLEECNLLIPSNKAVLFELSKNYLKLKKLPEAIAYGNEALNLDKDNLWILEHLVKVHKRNYDFDKAITLQKELIKKHPKKKQQLVFLHLQNKDLNSAKRVLNELAEAKMLTSRLRSIKDSLEGRKKTKTPVKKVENLANSNLKLVFEKDKNFKSLQKLLADLHTKNDTDLLKYSEKGMVLFPAQPLVYLMNGTALNRQKNYKKATESLQNGIDFVIDNTQMESKFYTQLLKAYQGLGDLKNVRKYRKKLKL